MRAALISITGQPRDAASGAYIGIGGKPLAQRQLDFALSTGAERIILLGDKAGAEAAELRSLAERAGAKVQQVETGHGLLGTVGATDELLVLAPGLLPEAPEALELLEKGSAVLVLPSALGVAAGFERIDLEKAWAGAVVLPGRLVERLAELPPDSEPASALLRIALQARIPDRRLTESVLAEGSWAMIAPGGDRSVDERAWLRRNLAPARPTRISGWLARRVLQRTAGSLLDRKHARPALVAGAAVLLGGAVLAALFGLAPLAFVLLAIGAFGGDLAGAFARLSTSPFPAGKRAQLVSPAFEWLAEAALGLCAAFAIDQDWLHRLFPPLVLFGLLRTLRPAAWPGAKGLAGDPVALALLLAVASAFGLAEPAIMVLVLAIIGLQAAKTLPRRG